MTDLTSLAATFVLGVIAWFTYQVYIWPCYISPLRKIPGPSSENPLYGNLKTYFLEEAGEPHLRWIKKYGNIVKYHGFLNKPIILIADPKILQEMTLNQAYDFIKPPKMLNGLIKILGFGLVAAEGDSHRRQRKMMNPAFTHNNIKNMIPTFTRISWILKSLIEDKVKDESKIILSNHISKATLDIIGSVGFNYDFNSLKSPNDLADAYYALMGSTSTMRIIISILSNYIPFIRKVPISANAVFNNSIKIIERESKKLIKEKYNEDKNNKLNGQQDLLSLLINTNKTLPIEERLTDDELRYQIMTFLFAGHETSATATCWALYLLSQHPREQDLLREELVKAFPDKSKFNPTFDEINSLEHLNCVVKETLRLIPPVAAINRTNTKDKFFNEYFFPEGTTLLIPIGALHRLPSIWGPTADNFDPKRWLNPSLIKNVTNLNYLPFLTGTRSCIGNKLALNEIKVLLSMLVRNFVFQPIEGLHIRKRVFPITKPDPYLELNISKVEA